MCWFWFFMYIAHHYNVKCTYCMGTFLCEGGPRLIALSVCLVIKCKWYRCAAVSRASLSLYKYCIFVDYAVCMFCMKIFCLFFFKLQIQDKVCMALNSIWEQYSEQNSQKIIFHTWWWFDFCILICAGLSCYSSVVWHPSPEGRGAHLPQSRAS